MGPKGGNVGGSVSTCESGIIQKVAATTIGDESSRLGRLIKKRLNRASNERRESRILECEANATRSMKWIIPAVSFQIVS